jgi:hypothetical protein
LCQLHLDGRGRETESIGGNADPTISFTHGLGRNGGLTIALHHGDRSIQGRIREAIDAPCHGRAHHQVICANDKIAA